jgi:hypothetical protein
VQVVGAVDAMQSGRHDKPMISAASYPPLHKTQGRGTHSFITGKKKPSVKGRATRQLTIAIGAAQPDRRAAMVPITVTSIPKEYHKIYLEISSRCLLNIIRCRN